MISKADKKKKCTITVTVGTPVTKVKLNKTKSTMTIGKKQTLKATVTPKKASSKAVVWKSSNKKVATVTKDQVKQIAETKMQDLNAADVEAAMRMIEGTARSMGFTVEG